MTAADEVAVSTWMQDFTGRASRRSSSTGPAARSITGHRSSCGRGTVSACSSSSAAGEDFDDGCELFVERGVDADVGDAEIITTAL